MEGDVGLDRFELPVGKHQLLIPLLDRDEVGDVRRRHAFGRAAAEHRFDAHPYVVDVADRVLGDRLDPETRSEEHTSELQSLMRISYAVFCLKKKTTIQHTININSNISIPIR